LVARLSEGTQRLVITDTLPLGLLPELLALPNGTGVVSTGASISAGPGGTLTPAVVIAGQTVTFDFGTVVNAGDNFANAGDLVTLRISARVLDLAVNVSGRIVTNDADATISSPTNPAAPGGTVTDDAAVPAAIVEPALALDKAVDRPSGDAGDVFTYTLTLTTLPGATGPAFDVTVQDILSPHLVLVPGSLSASFGTATIAGNTITVAIPALAPNAAPITITYRAAFADSIEPGQVVPNTATVDWTSAPGGGRAYADDASAAVRGVFALALDKAIIATSLPETGSGFFDPTLPDVAAGETVTWRLTATISEGTQRLVIADALPAGLVAESARLVALGPGITAGAPVITLAADSVVFDFGTVVNTGNNAGPDSIVVEVTARLSALPAAGTVLTNTATATASAPSAPGAPGGTLTATGSASSEAVAAVLVFDKQASKTVVGLGDTLTYTLVLQHAAGSTAPAYGVVLADPLSDPALALVSGSVIASAGSIVQGNAGGDRGVTVTLPVLLPGETLTVSFTVRTVGVPVAGGIAPNTAEFASTSAPGPQPPGFTRPLSGSDSQAIQIIGSPLPGGFEAGLLPDLEDALRRLRTEAPRIGGIITGTAQPLSTVVLEFLDATGTPIRIGSTTADVGGNWVARAPEAIPAGFSAEAFQAVRSVVGRTADAGLGAEPLPSQSSLLPPTPLPLAGGAPYTVAAAAIASPGDLGGQVVEPVAVTFAGGISPGGVFTGARGLGDAGTQGGLSRATPGPDRAAAEAEFGGGLALNRFALDFLRSQVSPTALGR
ncbi:MAG: DUF11 domain-containing protein, partial [Acetobacteraceae bacterium]|nr:DUF11 domain-containing protein [Acetobacteraceae bacterium]